MAAAMSGLAPALSIACLACVAALLVAERRQHPAAAALAKSSASLCFIAVALVLDASASRYGQWVLAALVLSAIGDVCLLSERPRAFLAGLGFFLLAHLVFAIAFAAGLHSGAVLAWSAVAMGTVGLASLRWLSPHLGASFRAPVLAYIVAIMAMCTLALGFGARTGAWLAALGALLFAASDLAVARQRFVRRAFLNKAWGLPAYYVAQLMLAWSVAD